MAFLTRTLALVCLALTASHAATYYVDQTAGNDASAGTSPSAPWRNCPGMAAYAGAGTIRPGDTVYFDRGDVWLLTGTQGLYLTGGVTYLGNEWGTGAKATLRANADLEAGVVRFRDHATIPTVLRGFDVDGNGKVTTGVDINHAFWSLMNGATKRVEDCEVHHIWSRTSQNQYKYGIIISNWGGTGGYAENVEIINCVVHDTSRDAVCLYPSDVNRDARIRNIVVRGCHIFNTGQDPDYGAGAAILVKGYVQDAFIEHNHAHDTKGAILFVNGNESQHFGVGPTNVHIRYNLFHGDTGHGAIRVYDGASGKDPKDLKIYGNIVYNSTSLGGFYIGSDLGNTLQLRMYNNLFFNAPVVISNNSATVNLFEFHNNIVYHTGGVPLTDSARKITAHGNNLFYRGSGTLVSSGGTSYSASNIASYEATALSASPGFKDATSLPTGFLVSGTGYTPDRDGFSLLPTSPARATAQTLAAGYDGSINSVLRPAGAWDRGPYQASGDTGVPAAPSGLTAVPVSP